MKGLFLYIKRFKEIMAPGTKENIQYICALVSFLSGILMCFLSFFLNKYDINSSVLGYFGECLIFTSAVFGINLYMRTKFGELESSIKDKVDGFIKEALDNRQDK